MRRRESIIQPAQNVTFITLSLAQHIHEGTVPCTLVHQALAVGEIPAICA